MYVFVCVVYAAQNVCIASCIHVFSGVCIVYAYVCVVFLCMRLYAVVAETTRVCRTNYTRPLGKRLPSD